MFILNILNFSRGYLTIKVTGDYPERFINMCSGKNINIWNVKSRGQKTLTACVSVKGFRHLKEVCRATGSKLHIISKKGLPFVSFRLRRRTGLVLGFVFFLFAMIWLCSHIWYIDITDNTSIPKEELMHQLELSGIKQGTPIREIKPGKVQASMLNLNPKLAWVWPTVKGTSIYIDLRERVTTPEILPTNQPCNIVASHSGLISSMLVKEGRSIVSKDMYVSQGQLLVGGIMDSSAIGVRYVHSDAEIWAITQESVSESFPLETIESHKTGNSSVSYTLKLGNFNLSTPVFGGKFNTCETETFESVLHIGNIYFPISFIKTQYMETINETALHPKEQVIAQAQQYLENLLQNSLKNGMILEKNFDVQTVDDKTIGVTLNATCNRQIAQKQPIEEENKIGPETN